MKISVVIPTHRRPELLRRCIAALKKQVFPKDGFEIIVVTDGPDERSLRTVRSMMHRDYIMKLYSLPSKEGPAAARNFGWRAANGVLIAFTDEDCIPDKKWLLSLWNTFLQVAVSKVTIAGKTIVPIPERPTDYQLNVANREQSEFITANCACCKAALEAVGGFDEAFRSGRGEDSDLQLKLLCSKIPIIRVPSAIVVHPVQQPPWGVSLYDTRKEIDHALLFKKYPVLYRQKIRALLPWGYYGACLTFLSAVIFISTGWLTASTIAFSSWLIGTVWFCWKRLSRTTRRVNHVVEMLLTSSLIPFLAVYYRFYGVVKYRLPLLF